MAEIGDAALARGMDLVDGASTDAKDIDLEINKTRDYIAQFRGTSGAVEGLSAGGLIDVGTAASLVAFTVPEPIAKGAALHVLAQVEIVVAGGANYAGYLQMRRGATVLHQRRWHSHTIPNRQLWPVMETRYTFDAEVPEGTTFTFVGTNDPLSSGSIGVWYAYAAWAVV